MKLTKQELEKIEALLQFALMMFNSDDDDDILNSAWGKVKRELKAMQ